MHSALWELHQHGLEPASASDDVFVHVYRELNVLPDHLAGNPFDAVIWHKPKQRIRLEGQLVCQFDGSGASGRAGAAFVIWSSTDPNFEYLKYEDIAVSGSWHISDVRAVDSELRAAWCLLQMLRHLLIPGLPQHVVVPRLPSRPCPWQS